MGIVAVCPNGHRIKVKDELAGRKGVCPTCAARFRIPRKEARPDAAPPRDVPADLPIAGVVSVDPRVVASLPAAAPLEEVGTERPIAADSADDPLEVEMMVDERDDDPPPATARRSHAALDERPESLWLIAVRGGTPSPPLSAAALAAWLESGAATPDHVVWREGWPEWRPLGDVFPGAQPPGPPGWP